MKQRNLFNRIYDVISDKDLWFIIVLFLISLYFLVTGFYSYGKVDLSELEKVDGIGYNFETDMSGRLSFITFKTSSDDRFYIMTNGLKKGNVSDFAKTLENTFTSNGEATIYYTNRRLFAPTFYSFSSYRRVVAIETESETIISVDDYNNALQDRFIGSIVGSVLFLLFAIGMIKLRY